MEKTIKENLEEIKEQVKGIGEEAKTAAAECREASAAYDELNNKITGKILTEEETQKVANAIRGLDMIMHAYCFASEKTKSSLTEVVKNTVKELSAVFNIDC